MKVGYKGIVDNSHPGYVSAPYIPFQLTTWQDKLRDLEFKFASWLKIGNVTIEGGLEDVNLMMKTWYPGNYTVIAEYIPDRNFFRLAIKFDDPKERTMWLIKWS